MRPIRSNEPVRSVTMIHSSVLQPSDLLQRTVAPPAIGVDDCSRAAHTYDDREQRLWRPILDNLKVSPSRTKRCVDDAKNPSLSCRMSPVVVLRLMRKTRLVYRQTTPGPPSWTGWLVIYWCMLCDRSCRRDSQCSRLQQLSRLRFSRFLQLTRAIWDESISREWSLISRRSNPAWLKPIRCCILCLCISTRACRELPISRTTIVEMTTTAWRLTLQQRAWH